MKEAPPPENLPSLDALAEYDDMKQHEATSADLPPVVAGEQLVRSRPLEAIAWQAPEVSSPANKDTVAAAYAESVQAASRYSDRMRAPSMDANSSTPSDDPIGAAIEASVARERELTTDASSPVETTVVPPALQVSAWEAMQRMKGITPNSPSTPEQQGVAVYFAERNAAEAERQKSQSAVAKMVSGAKAVKSGMDATARFLDKHLLGEDPLAVAREKNNQQMDLRTQAFERWTQPPATETTLQSAPVSSEKVPRPVPLVRQPSLEIPPPSGPAEEKARETWGMKNNETSGLEKKGELLRLRAEEIRIKKEQLKLMKAKIDLEEEELTLRMQENALAAEMAKHTKSSR